jgi:integrase/recombinase XerD
MSALKDKMTMDLQLKGFSEQTQKAYISHVKAYSKHFGQSPDKLGIDEIKEYLHYLIMERKLSKSYINTTYSGLKFFYTVTLGREWELKQIPRVKKDKKLPTVLSKGEVQKLFNATTNLKHKAILMTVYGAGLRVSEVANLKPNDIDSENMQIHIRLGKGNKDRYTILSKVNLAILREYWKLYRPGVWLFPSVNPLNHLSTRTMERVFELSKQKAGIKKAASIHTLRHSFATHLLESGVAINYIQLLLGHTSVKTTCIYIHLASTDALNLKSPLDTFGDNKNDRDC